MFSEFGGTEKKQLSLYSTEVVSRKSLGIGRLNDSSAV